MLILIPGMIVQQLIVIPETVMAPVLADITQITNSITAVPVMLAMLPETVPLEQLMVHQPPPLAVRRATRNAGDVMPAPALIIPAINMIVLKAISAMLPVSVKKKKSLVVAQNGVVTVGM
jgi:hypothetical protein